MRTVLVLLPTSEVKRNEREAIGAARAVAKELGARVSVAFISSTGEIRGLLGHSLNTGTPRDPEIAWGPRRGRLPWGLRRGGD
jgi:hypothetical protein